MTKKRQYSANLQPLCSGATYESDYGIRAVFDMTIQCLMGVNDPSIMESNPVKEGFHRTV